MAPDRLLPAKTLFGRADWSAVALLSGLWVAVVLAVGVGGEFPVNDDWAYAIMVERFLESGKIRPTSWTFVPTISNTWLGALASEICGYSHVALRSTSLILGWFGMLGAYVLTRVSNKGVLCAVAIASAYAFNPIHLNMAFSFMTDVAFSAWFTWTLVGAMVALRIHPIGYAVFAFFCALSLLSRQPAAVLPVGFAGAVLVTKSRNLSKLFRACALAAVVGGGAIFLLDAVLAKDMRILHLIITFASDPWGYFHLAVNSLTMGSLVGLFAFPFLPLCSQRALRAPLPLAATVALATAILLLLLKLDRPLLLPRPGQILNVHGLGVLSIHGAHDSLRFPVEIRWIVTAIGAVVAAIAVVTVVVGRIEAGVEETHRDPVFVLLVLCSALYLAPICLKSTAFDRYLLPAVAPLLIVFAHDGGRSHVPWRRLAVSGLAFATFILFGTLGTRDFMAHLRVRNAVVAMAIDDYGAELSDVQGGFEYDGEQRYELIDETAKELTQFVEDSDEPGFALDRFSLSIRNTARNRTETYPLSDRFLVSLAPLVQEYTLREQVEWPVTLFATRQYIYLHERTQPFKRDPNDLSLLPHR